MRKANRKGNGKETTMTLTIELAPDLEQRLYREAAQKGIPVQEYALRLLEAGAANAEEDGEERVRRALMEAGLLADVKRRPRKPSVHRKRFMTAPIQGKPISETVIEERR